MLTQNKKKYEDLTITTMTMVIQLSGRINVVSAFHLLPITVVDEKQCTKQ